MKPHVFYKINNYYVYLNKKPNVSNASGSAFSFYDQSFFQRYKNKSIIHGKLLCQDLQLEDISPNRQYIVFLSKEDFNYVLFVPFVSPGSLSFKRINKDAIIESAIEQAKLIIMYIVFLINMHCGFTILILNIFVVYRVLLQCQKSM